MMRGAMLAVIALYIPILYMGVSTLRKPKGDRMLKDIMEASWEIVKAVACAGAVLAGFGTFYVLGWAATLPKG
jgi:hypothetical protein